MHCSRPTTFSRPFRFAAIDIEIFLISAAGRSRDYRPISVERRELRGYAEICSERKIIRRSLDVHISFSAESSWLGEAITRAAAVRRPGVD